MLKPIETFTVVVLSTGHLTKEVAEGLDAIIEMRRDNTQHHLDPEDWRYWVIAESWSEYGWWIWADIEDGISELPASLYDCLCFARESNCRWIMFDCDGPLEEGLTRYEW